MSKRVILGAAVKAIREAKAETNPEYVGSRFAIACQMSHAHLCNIEAGRKLPPAETVHRIAAMLRVPVDAISYTVEIATEAVA